jgi:hypothetical protein
VLFGETNLQSQQDYLQAGHAEAFRFTAQATGTIGAAQLYLDAGSAATTAIVGIYAEGHEHPGALLSVGALAAPAAGAWNTIALSASAISAGNGYWLAILGEGGTLRYRDRSRGPCPSEESARHNLAGMPSTWSTGHQWHDCPVSAYVTAAPELVSPPSEPTPPPVEATPPPTEPTPPPTEPTPPPPPANTAPPTITGTTTEGQTLSASTGTWLGSPTSYRYQWLDCDASGQSCTTVEGATSPSYRLTAADVSHTMRVKVTAENAGGSSSMSSPATEVVAAEPPPPLLPPVNTAPPTVTGTTTEGQTLTATAGTWNGSPTSYAYQWQDCNTVGEACSNIAGAVAATYVLAAGDVGQTLRVAVTATNAGGSAQASSAQTATIAAKPSEGAGCSVVLSGVSGVNAALKAGAVVCLAAGTYGPVSITSTPASNATLTAAPGAHVVVAGVNIAASNITVSQLHSTGAINVGAGSPYPGYNHDIIEHNDVGPTNGYGISVMSATSTPSSYITIKGNRIHDTSTSGEGDALRFDGWNNITVAENDIYNIKECPSDTCHTDTLQSYNGGVPTTGLTITRNYTHDNTGAQGLPFLKDGDISNVTITDNLSLHNTNTNGQVTGIWVDENINNLTITNNTYQDTSGSIVQADGSAKNPTVNINHNVFDNLNVRPGSGPSYTVTEDYDIFTENDEYTFNPGPHSTTNTTPTYTEPTTNNYQLNPNPNHTGIDWTPTQQQYGPTN